MLFGGALQSPQRVGRPGDEPAAEEFLDKLPRQPDGKMKCQVNVTRLECASIGVI
jgi:hypothetical protein